MIGCQGILRRNGCRSKRMDVWQRAVDTDRFNPAFRSDEWRSRITDGHPERVVLTYVGRLGAGARLYALGLLPHEQAHHRCPYACPTRRSRFSGPHLPLLYPEDSDPIMLRYQRCRNPARHYL